MRCRHRTATLNAVAVAALLLLGASLAAGAADDDLAALRAFIVARAASDARPAEVVRIVGDEYHSVAIVAADAAGPHLRGRDLDASLPWRVLDAAALVALAEPVIDRGDDATLAAWLRCAAGAGRRDRAFQDRLDRLRARDGALAASVDTARGASAAKAHAPSTATTAPAPTDAAAAPVEAATALAGLGADDAAGAPPSVAAWDAALFAKDGSLVRAAYVRACASVDARDIDHRLGPGWDAFHGAKGDAAGADAPEVFLRHDDGEYVWKEKGAKAVDWTGHGGQVLFVPDKPGDPGVDRMTFCWSYHENHGGAKFWHVYLMKPAITAKDGGQWWSELPDPQIATPSFAAAGGKDPVKVANAIGRARTSWCNNGVMAFRNGVITFSGSGNSYEPSFQLVLPPGKVPTAVALTNSCEIALVTVWDVAQLKGEVAVIALKTHQWLLPTTGFFSAMKLLGFIDLPKEMRCPSGIAASSDLVAGPDLDLAALRDPAKRAALADKADSTAQHGFAVVISRAENRACFIDLTPLFQWVRASRLGPAAAFAATEEDGPEAKQWPFTFDVTPAARPRVVQSLAIGQPTAVATGFRTGDDAGFATKAVIATMDGKLVVVEVGRLGSAAAKDAPIAPVGVLRVGRNPTSIALGQRDLGPSNSMLVVCRGDRAIHWVKVVGDQAQTIKVLRDRRLVDPVAAEPSNTRFADVVSVADFKGRQIVNYLRAPIAPWYEPLFGGLGADGKAEFECTGVAKIPGFPYQVSGAEVP